MAAVEEKATGEDPGFFERNAGIDEDRASESTGNAEDILALQDLDPALNAKMHLVNNVRHHPPDSATLPTN